MEKMSRGNSYYPRKYRWKRTPETCGYLFCVIVVIWITFTILSSLNLQSSYKFLHILNTAQRPKFTCPIFYTDWTKNENDSTSSFKPVNRVEKCNILFLFFVVTLNGEILTIHFPNRIPHENT